MERDEAPSTLVNSLDCGISALLLLLDRENLSVTDIAVELGIARSTAHRLLSTLEYRGLVARPATGRGYSAGPILSDLSMPYGLDEETRRWVAPVLDDAVERTGTIVYTGVLLGSKLLLVDGRMPPNPPARNLTGIARPAYRTSPGMVLLSRLKREQVDALYPNERLFHTSTDKHASRTAFFKGLEEVRKHGYAIATTDPNGDGVAILLAGRTWRDGISLQAVIAKRPNPRPELVRLAGLLKESAATLDWDSRPSRRGYQPHPAGEAFQDG